MHGFMGPAGGNAESGPPGVMTLHVLEAMASLVQDGVRDVLRGHDNLQHWLSPEQRERIDTLIRTTNALLELAAVEREEGNLLEAQRTIMLAFEQYGHAAGSQIEALTEALGSHKRRRRG